MNEGHSPARRTNVEANLNWQMAAHCFLNEIGDMSLKAQAKVLRALEYGEVQRLGGSQTLHVDVRVIAATNKALDKEIANETFRQDLYYRLNVVPISVPPLRNRLDDLPLLVKHLCRAISSGQCAARLR